MIFFILNLIMITYNEVYEDFVKIKICDEKLIIYLYNHKLELSNNKELVKELRDILIKINNNYEFDLGGIYNALIYENYYYGYVIEIDKIKKFEYSDYIDLKIKIKYNQPFYCFFDNYKYIENCRNIYFDNNLYIVNIDELSNVNSIFEFGDIVYNNYLEILSKSVKIK